MAQPRWSIWDYFGAKDKAYAHEKIQRPTHFNEFRCRDRIKNVADLVTGTPGAVSAGAVAADLHKRTTYWLDQFESGRDGVPPAEIRPKWVRNTIISAMVVLPLTVAVIWIIHIDHPILVGAIVLVPLASFGAWPLFQEARRTTLQFTARFRARQCPDCGHDFSQLSPAIDPDQLHGQWVGPAACPMCGVPWPMVPPPVPASEVASRSSD